ncbi:stage V sporulation protein S [Lutispora thermophila]|uniref:Stage V sporulation protein SpoVS n=1 Tax=Lutispora thermophila DSM 19022 TaxID=1122184 RepID=A0A1M6HSD0_9FIRM|nr:stage V sporulation protein S [Lutispora thermophila]SHJ25075.1 Stage V sporulation protein SpoVS [Lutispora thermophila DSM 19022]
MNIQVLKVAGDSNVNSVSDKIIQHAVNDGIVHVDCIGVKATYTAVRAIILATEYLVKEGYKFNLRPYYTEVDVQDNDKMVQKTAIRWTIVAKKK